MIHVRESKKITYGQSDLLQNVCTTKVVFVQSMLLQYIQLTSNQFSQYVYSQFCQECLSCRLICALSCKTNEKKFFFSTMWFVQMPTFSNGDWDYSDVLEKAFLQGKKKVDFPAGPEVGCDKSVVDFEAMEWSTILGNKNHVYSIIRKHTAALDASQLWKWKGDGDDGRYFDMNTDFSFCLNHARDNHFDYIRIFLNGTAYRCDMAKRIQKNENTSWVRTIIGPPSLSEKDMSAYDSLPDKYKCPITQDIMDDPVIASDGHTYERYAIEKAMYIQCSRGKIRSPMTNLPLEDNKLIPNRLVKNIIDEKIEEKAKEGNGEAKKKTKKGACKCYELFN